MGHERSFLCTIFLEAGLNNCSVFGEKLFQFDPVYGNIHSNERRKAKAKQGIGRIWQQKYQTVPHMLQFTSRGSSDIILREIPHGTRDARLRTEENDDGL